MENLKEQKVGELVAENYQYADVFKKYDIDFCCGGGVTIGATCLLKNIDLNQLEKELSLVKQQQPVVDNPASWPISKLISHIVNHHHHYVRENMPYIIAYADKVAKVHGLNHPEVIEISRLVNELQSELFMHMHKEEVVLFPFINQLQANKTISGNPFSSIKSPIEVMLLEHDLAGDILKEVRNLSANYTPPNDACTTYKVLFDKLKNFEEDLHRHIHLENNILFLKAIELERKMYNN